MKKITISLLSILLSIGLSACQQKSDKNTIRIGTISGPETTLMEVAKKVALKKYGLHLNIVTFSDYTVPNMALNDGSIDANMFQHLPYLKAQIKNRGYKLVSIGKVFVYPMGIYSKKIHQLKDVPQGASVGIPNDPSNEARALWLLQKAGLMTLKKGATMTATPNDVADNPKKLKFIELNAAQLPRALDDLSLAVINTNYAIPSGLSPRKDALYAEGHDSLYANIVAVRIKDKNNPAFQHLMASLHSAPVLKKAQELFGDGAIPAWKQKNQHRSANWTLDKFR